MHANAKSAKATREQLIESKRQYEETKERYETTDRIKIMPYLILEKVKTEERNNKIAFELTMKNCGNGSAVDLYIFTEDYNSPLFQIVYKNLKTYILTSPIDKSFLQINEVSNFEILRNDVIEDPQYADRINIKLKFKDMFGYKYEQIICFEYMGYDVGRIESYSPKLTGCEEEL